MPKTAMPARQPKEDLIKVRCSTDLKSRVVRHAFSRDSDIATVTREALVLYLAQYEMRPLAGR